MTENELTPEERNFMLKLVQEHRMYYQAIVSHPKCSAATREKGKFIEALYQKLSQEDYDRTK